MLTMTWEDFKSDCENFMYLSKTFEDGWEMVSLGPDVGQTYLKIIKKVEANVTSPWNEEEDSLEEHFDFENSGPIQPKIITVEYNLIYSQSYQVPMLFFRGFLSSKFFF